MIPALLRRLGWRSRDDDGPIWHIVPQSEIDALESEWIAAKARFEAMIAERDRVIEVISKQPDRSRNAVQIARNFLMRRELTS
jgi:hypothetical protein